MYDNFCDGKILAYHGTDASVDFDRFAPGQDLGIHFGSLDAAHARLRAIAEDDGDIPEFHRIIPCYLSLENPLRLDDCYTWGPTSVIAALAKAGVISGAEYFDLSESGYLDEEVLIEILGRSGHDSIVYDNATEGGGDSYIVLDPSKIEFKLAGFPIDKKKPVPRP